MGRCDFDAPRAFDRKKSLENRKNWSQAFTLFPTKKSYQREEALLLPKVIPQVKIRVKRNTLN
jgi:hypothetical protein